MSNYGDLYVMWREPKSNRRHVIGQLGRDSEGFSFAYSRTGVEEAAPRGFYPLPEFPGIDQAYTARHLFSTFAQRVPSPRRPDFKQLIESWLVSNPDDPLEILANSGGLLATDQLELAAVRPNDDRLDEPLICRLAGAGHYADEFGKLQIGDSLQLARDIRNENDPSAVRVLRQDAQVGWVPKQYSKLIARLLDEGVQLDVRIKGSVRAPELHERMLLRISRLSGGLPQSTPGLRV
ncbi:MAG: HIRAN domain-containing protein [Myxococcota bacterium]